jgi:hypothetical protein
MEIAMRAAETGRRVGLLCFNQLVGDWMRHRVTRIAPILPNLIAGRAIQIMAEMTGIQIPDNPSGDFWETDLPQAIEERLTDPDFSAVASFDYLVLDEAQDFLSRPRLWQCVGQFLATGTDSGAFALIGDYDNQVLGNRELLRKSLADIDASARPVHWRLSENCRNYRIVGETAAQLGGMGNAVYSGYLRNGGSVRNYNISFYNDDESQLVQLGQMLREFKAEGYKPSEITLLSFRADEFSSAMRLRHAGFKLKPARQPGDMTSFTSVHAFKGMENKIIILTDVILGEQDFHRDLFYTGMTRATESVRVLCRNGSQATLFEWITGGKGEV